MKTRIRQTAVKRRAHHRPARHKAAALRLAAQCTVAEAESLQSELARRLSEPAPVTVDVNALERIDTAGLQLLAAFVRDRRTAGRAVEWRGRPSALDAAAGLLGLCDMLELAGEAGR
ncbi:MAG: STAS domain-containing protein [Steroidobacteraceae bacterium]